MKIFKILGALFWAIPATLIWNALAPIYLSQIPQIYQDLPYWHVAGFFVLIRILAIVLHPHRHFGGHRHWHKFKKFSHFYKGGWGKQAWSRKYYHPHQESQP